MDIKVQTGFLETTVMERNIMKIVCLGIIQMHCKSCSIMMTWNSLTHSVHIGINTNKVTLPVYT